MDKVTHFQEDFSINIEKLNEKALNRKRKTDSNNEFDRQIINTNNLPSNKKSNKFSNSNEIKLAYEDNIPKSLTNATEEQKGDQFSLPEVKNYAKSKFLEDGFFHAEDNEEKEHESISSCNKTQNNSDEKHCVNNLKSNGTSSNINKLKSNVSGKTIRPNTGKTMWNKKTKGRVKINMEFIENKIRRYTTFSKRKTGIMKKAYELSTLTGTQVMLLVASETGHVYTFATNKLQPMITSEVGKNLIQSCLSYQIDGETGNNSNFDNGKISIENIDESELRLNHEDDDLESTNFDNESEDQ